MESFLFFGVFLLVGALWVVILVIERFSWEDVRWAIFKHLIARRKDRDPSTHARGKQPCSAGNKPTRTP